MHVIVGATGHTGSAVAEKLLAAGAQVRVLGRDAKKLERFVQRGAQAVACDMTDAAAVEKAFAGARAAHVLIPPNLAAPDVPAYQDRVTDNLAAALRSHRVAHAVVVSSTGADKTYGTGPVLGLHKLEEKLKAIDGLNVLSLRCGHFMENLLVHVGIIQSFGFMAGALRADLPLPMIATRDIADVSAEALEKLDFSGFETRELLGPRHISFEETARIIGAAIGKQDLAYKQLPAMVLKPAMTRMGMSPSMADMMLEMSDALNTGLMKSQEPRSARNTTPTTVNTFVEEVFVPTYRAKAAGA
jgi:uncharacterized protein YbjT (DUF2867 family)